MASAAALARRTGFNALLAADGEPLTLQRAAGDVALRAIVDRAPERPVDRDRVDFTEREASMIEFFQTAVTAPPEAGDNFTDAGGAFHRIKKVPRVTDWTYRCECDVSRPT